MFESRLRILDVGECSFLGTVERFTETLFHSPSPKADLMPALVKKLTRLQDPEVTRFDRYECPIASVAQTCLGRGAG